jgi:hypothetical protein
VTRCRRPVTALSPDRSWGPPTLQGMVSPDDVANALRLPDGSLIMDRADGDDQLEAEPRHLHDAGWQVISRRERPGQSTVITWAKIP